MYDKYFIGYTLVLALRLGGFLYTSDNYKQIAYTVVKDDTMTSVALAISNVFAMVGKIVAPYFWVNFGFSNANLGLSIVSSIVLLYVVVLAT